MEVAMPLSREGVGLLGMKTKFFQPEAKLPAFKRIPKPKKGPPRRRVNFTLSAEEMERLRTMADERQIVPDQFALFIVREFLAGGTPVPLSQVAEVEES
jgi:hypothetical protein